jgi:thiamine-monophosphate kinase
MESPQVQPDLEDQRYIIGRLLKPEARKDIIEFFAVAGIKPTAMMDISDGLSSELLHICRQSGVGCLIYEDKLPIDEDTRNFAYKLELDPTACALSGGEDYELLFTVPQSDYDKIATNAQISVIGYVTESAEGSHILTKGGNKYPITAQGWKAF